MRRLVHAAFAITMALVACAGFAQDKPCSNADAAAAEKAIDRVVSWGQLQKAYQDYRHCDAGPVDDQFTDALMRMMVDWKNPGQLAGAMDKDPAYAAFVVKHLKSPSAAKEDRTSAYSRAKEDCPAGLNAFCEKIAEAAKP